MDTAPLPAALSAPAPTLEPRFLEPEGFRWGHFTARDGARLRWGYLPAGTTRDCILVGGFMEFVEKYFETARDFQVRRFNVWCLDWRGQGRSTRSKDRPSRPAARNYDQDAEDLAHFITAVSPRENRCLLVAHSMGGAISLLTFRGHTTLVDAAILSAPMLGLNTGNVPRWIARLLARGMTAAGYGDVFVPGAGPWPNAAPRPPDGSRVSSDPLRGTLLDAWFTAHEDLRLDGPTYAWLDAAFALTARTGDGTLLSQVHTPILMGSAGQDLLVDPAAHLRAATLLPNCRLVTFAAAKHELFQETDAIRERWFNAIDGFIAEHIRPTP